MFTHPLDQCRKAGCATLSSYPFATS